MNTFRMISRFSVAMIVILLSGNINAFDLNSFTGPIAKIASNKSVNTILLGAGTGLGADIAKDLYGKKSPVVPAVLAGLFSQALDGNPNTAVVAGGTSLILSAARAYAPEVAAVDAVTGKLPQCLTSEEAKMAAQIAVSIAIARSVVGAAGNNNNG